MAKKAFLGVYSAQGKDLRGNLQKTLYFAWQTGATYSVQRLDGAYKALGAPRDINEGAFKTLFKFEPSILAAPVAEARPAHAPAPPDAPAPAATPPKDDVEATLRAHFNKAVSRLKYARDKKAAFAALQTLVEVEEGIEENHKHMFAEFGATLRKAKHYDMALAFCMRVLALAPHDDHASFNASRVLLEMGRWDDAERHLRTAMSMTSNVELYERMLRHLRKERQKRLRPVKLHFTYGRR